MRVTSWTCASTTRSLKPPTPLQLYSVTLPAFHLSLLSHRKRFEPSTIPSPLLSAPLLTLLLQLTPKDAVAPLQGADAVALSTIQTQRSRASSRQLSLSKDTFFRDWPIESLSPEASKALWRPTSAFNLKMATMPHLSGPGGYFTIPFINLDHGTHLPLVLLRINHPVLSELLPRPPTLSHPCPGGRPFRVSVVSFILPTPAAFIRIQVIVSQSLGASTWCGLTAELFDLPPILEASLLQRAGRVDVSSEGKSLSETKSESDDASSESVRTLLTHFHFLYLMQLSFPVRELFVVLTLL